MISGVKIPTTRNGKATFNIIVETAIELFYINGYHSTTIGNITSEAGIGAGTFYLYFANKKALYTYILMEFQHDIRKRIATKVNQVEGRFEKEKEGLKTFIKYALENPHSYNIIWESLYIDRELFINYYDTFAKRYEVGLKESVEKEEMYDVDTELVSYILMGVSNFIGLKVLLKLGDNNSNVDQIVDNVMNIIRTGIFK
ncbi:TetR/AcrR family transcriptional regulator [Mycoplasmatota bacterium]|nr:TetR/AcrR family transcriptional regulator [Mycoplasmatota bacterium]